MQSRQMRTQQQQYPNVQRRHVPDTYSCHIVANNGQCRCQGASLHLCIYQRAWVALGARASGCATSQRRHLHMTTSCTAQTSSHTYTHRLAAASLTKPKMSLCYHPNLSAFYKPLVGPLQNDGQYATSAGTLTNNPRHSKHLKK